MPLQYDKLGRSFRGTEICPDCLSASIDEDGRVGCQCGRLGPYAEIPAGPVRLPFLR